MTKKNCKMQDEERLTLVEKRIREEKEREAGIEEEQFLTKAIKQMLG